VQNLFQPTKKRLQGTSVRVILAEHPPVPCQRILGDIPRPVKLPEVVQDDGKRTHYVYRLRVVVSPAANRTPMPGPVKGTTMLAQNPAKSIVAPLRDAAPRPLDDRSRSAGS
jgi:hypothetical protein